MDSSCVFENEFKTAKLVWHSKSGSHGRDPLDSRVHTSLIKWMHSTGYFHRSNFIPKLQVTLEQFYAKWELMDETKPEAARKYYKDKIARMAKEHTTKVKQEGGYEGDLVKKGSTIMIYNATYSRGYEHILDPDWNGDRQNKWLSPKEFLKGVTYGYERNLYTDSEWEELMQMMMQVNARRAIDRKDLNREDLLGSQESVRTACVARRSLAHEHRYP